MATFFPAPRPMNPPRDHHFIPAFYLKQWETGTEEKLIEYSLQYGKLISKTVGRKATGFQTDLYAFSDLPPNMVQYLEEKFFDYADRTASDAYRERVGVCRDFAHLAITLCRCMNIPARYCTGYLGDIGVPPDTAPMDFSAWFEVYLDGRWLTFDARHNRPRIGRILIAYGRDAADVAISTSFGSSELTGFRVITDEVASQDNAPADRVRSLSFA